MVTADIVRELATRLPGTVDNDSAYEIHGKGFAWYLRQHVPGTRVRVVVPDVLAVRVPDLLDKEALIATKPDTFYSTPHYHNYPAVLVRLSAIDEDHLAELLEDAWRTRAKPKAIEEHDRAKGSARSMQVND